MKLQEALRKVIRQFGVSVIQEKKLISFLADYKAFEDYPAMRDVMKAIVMGDNSHPDYRARADVNGDTEISVADVSSLVAIVMSGINAPAIYPDVDRLVTVDALAIAPGESQTLNIRLSGAQDYKS